MLKSLHPADLSASLRIDPVAHRLADPGETVPPMWEESTSGLRGEAELDLPGITVRFLNPTRPSLVARGSYHHV